MKQNYLKIDNVAKAYGSVRALQGVSFAVRQGTIHAVLGENGAGKSTLMKIIKGEVEPDSGRVSLDGQRYERYDPAYTKQLGVLMVHQELAVFDNLSIAENLFPNLARFCNNGFVNQAGLLEAARKSLAIFELDIDPAVPLAQLTLGQKQLVEILRALNQPRRLLILDEPTSGLSTVEAERLMQLLRKLRNAGETILFISHRIPEILSSCDEVTVLRDGRYIESFDCRTATEAELVNRMAGRELAAEIGQRTSREVHGELVLEVSGLTVARKLEEVNLSIRKGEVVGLFGLEGSGSSDLAPAIFGLHHASGSVKVHGQPVDRPSPYALRRRKVSFVNTNRKEAGLFMRSSIVMNIVSPVLSRFARGFWGLNMRGAAQFARNYMDRFSVKAESAHVVPSTLSGGNQQKVMVATALADDPDIVLINEPTRGVDVGAKSEIHRHLHTLAAAGKSLLVMSSELPELIALCDRIVVMRSRRIAGQCDGDVIDNESVMRLAAGTLTKGAAA